MVPCHTYAILSCGWHLTRPCARHRFEAPLDSRLFTAIVEARVIKSAQEIEVMRYMNRVSSEAHLAVMRNCKPGLKECVAPAPPGRPPVPSLQCRPQTWDCR